MKERLLATCFSLTLACCTTQKAVPEDVFKSLHKKVYQSLQITDRGQLYDVLDNIFAKNEIERHFNRIGKFHKKKEADKVQIFIDDIEYKKIVTKGYTVNANWLVRGRIHHNQHIHQRSLEYQAKYTLKKENGHWKIVKSEVIEHEDFELSDEELEQANRDD